MSSAPKRPVSRQQMTGQEQSARFSRDYWLEAAYTAAADGGFGEVRVLTLARNLGVTRGSFYWHFEDQAALVNELVARWRDEQLRVQAQWRASLTQDPHADLLRLLDFALTRASSADHREMRFGLALRALGRSNPAVARIVGEVDDARRELFYDEFLRLLGNPEEARERAIVFYLAIAGGIQALARGSARSRSARTIRDAIARQLLRPS